MTFWSWCKSLPLLHFDVFAAGPRWPREIIKQPLLTETDHDDRCLTSSMGFEGLCIPWYHIDLKDSAKTLGQEKISGLPKKCKSDLVKNEDILQRRGDTDKNSNTQ